MLRGAVVMQVYAKVFWDLELQDRDMRKRKNKGEFYKQFNESVGINMLVFLSEMLNK
jgi:hypothetical protein